MDNKVKLSPTMIKVIMDMREGWILRCQVNNPPFLYLCGEPDYVMVDTNDFNELIEKGLVKADGSRSIIEYYRLTDLGKTIAI